MSTSGASLRRGPNGRSLRVGIVCLHTDPYAAPGSGDVGGMNVVVRHLCAAMAARGIHVEVVTRRSTRSAPAHEIIDGVEVHRLAVGPASPLPKGEHEEWMADFGRELALLGPYDLLHSHHWFSGIAALPVARNRGIPHLQSFHSIAAPPHTALAEGERPESPGRLAGERLLAQESDAILAVSVAEADTAVTRLGAARGRVRVVHPGVDTDLFHPGDVPSQRPQLAVAARLEPLKGVDLAIRALALLPSPRPLLRVAGGATADHAYVDSLAALAADLGVGEDLELLGPLGRSELATVLRESTIALVPSHTETYGLVALEASASGIPVIAGVAGGLVEAVRDGVTGTLVPTREPADWAAAIEHLLTDEAARQRLGSAGRELALRRTWDSVAAGTIACYQEALSGLPLDVSLGR